MSTRARAVLASVVGAFWTYVVLDFAMHAVILAPWWGATQGYWLPREALASRIPFAYGAFALYCIALCLLWQRLRPERARVGSALVFGAVTGGLFGLVSALGTYSIVRSPASFLLVAPAATMVCSAGAACAAEWVAGGVHRWRHAALLFAAGLLVLIVGVVVQTAARGGPQA
jgi:uncharacterized membrane protein